jgi:hypothetical protein
MAEVCVCGHPRRHHMGHGRAGAYDTCLAAHEESWGTICPCLRFVKAAKQP